MTQPSNTKVFVVHGHDHELRDEVAGYLKGVGLDPIVLQDQPNLGRTIIEKFEDYSNVAYALVLCTGDDEGRARRGQAPSKRRARQNVVVEWGFFCGKLGRACVAVLCEHDVEMPSDFAGIGYISAGPSLDWQTELHRELLAAGLPVKRVSSASTGAAPTLPPTWRMPHPRNPNFTGREELLAQVRGSLSSGKPAALTQALAGLGGIGKTQLAIEYAYRQAGEYEVVWWVRSEEPTQLASDYADLAVALGADPNVPDQRALVAAARQWLEQNGKWLLIFDNVPHPEDIKAYLPHGGTGHILVTSRDPNWRGVATPVSVPKLPRPESVAFLAKRLGRPEALAGELADGLGDFPLALAQAAAYLEATGISVADYLDLLRDRREELWKDKEHEVAPDEYTKTVATTWSMAMTELQEKDPAALDLLRLCAYLAPDDIPISMLREQAEKLPESLSAVMQDQLALNHTLAALRRYSLVEVAEDSLSLHRLLQAVVRDGMKEEERRKWIEAAAETVSAAFPQESWDVRAWPTCARLMPHGLMASDWAEPSGLAPGATGRILICTALYLKSRAEFAGARDLLVRALSIREKTYGPVHQAVAPCLNNLGSVLHDLGDLKGAKVYHQRALAISEKAYGPDHPSVATCADNLAIVLQALGEQEEAKALCEQALSIYEKAYGLDHPMVAIGLNNLGGMLANQGDPEGAKVRFERALAIDEELIGPNHPNVAVRLHNLGCVHARLGHTAEARDLLTRALDIRERFLGEDHPSTVGTRRLLESLPKL